MSDPNFSAAAFETATLYNEPVIVFLEKTMKP
jgi:hypothetical protein